MGLRRIRPNQAVGLPLTPPQREAICACAEVPAAFIDRVRNAAGAEAPFTLQELRELMGYLDAAAHTAEGARFSVFADLCEQIVALTMGHVEDEHAGLDDDPPAPMNACGEMERAALARLEPLLAQLETWVANAGLDLNELLREMQPETITSEDEVGVFIAPRERRRLLGLDALPRDIAATLRKAPEKQRKFSLPFGRVRVLADLVSSEHARGEGPDAKHWARLQDKLQRLVGRYVVEGDGFADALAQAAEGDETAKRAAVGHLLKAVAARRGGSREQGERRVDDK